MNKFNSINFPVVSVTCLGKEMSFNGKFDYPEESLYKPLNLFKMEIDDSPIFRYLYRQLQPKRHLEFGTWQGTGAVYCLEETNATVWTLNLLFGEKGQQGENVYGNYSYEKDDLKTWAQKIGMPSLENYHTDSLGFIGRMYLEKNFGNRVCQVYCDSKDWDISNYPSEFFDTVLIDGGHSKEIVISDTQKAFAVLKKEGIVLWHDFCPPVWEEFEVTRGVMEAIVAQWEWLQANTTKLFWISPSWILLGVKK